MKMPKRIDTLNSAGRFAIAVVCISAYFLFSETVLNLTVFKGAKTDFDYYGNLVFSKDKNVFKIQVKLNPRDNGNLDRMKEHYANAKNNSSPVPDPESAPDVFRDTGTMVYNVCHCIVLHRTASFAETCFGNGLFKEPEPICYSAVHDQEQNLDIITFEWRISE